MQTLTRHVVTCSRSGLGMLRTGSSAVNLEKNVYGFWTSKMYSSTVESGSKAIKTREEKQKLVAEFVQKYKASNNGRFPGMTLVRKEVGGSYNILKDIMQEIEKEHETATLFQADKNVECKDTNAGVSLVDIKLGHKKSGEGGKPKDAPKKIALKSKGRHVSPKEVRSVTGEGLKSKLVTVKAASQVVIQEEIRLDADATSLTEEEKMKEASSKLSESADEDDDSDLAAPEYDLSKTLGPAEKDGKPDLLTLDEPSFRKTQSKVVVQDGIRVKQKSEKELTYDEIRASAAKPKCSSDKSPAVSDSQDQLGKPFKEGPSMRLAYERSYSPFGVRLKDIPPDVGISEIKEVMSHYGSIANVTISKLPGLFAYSIWFKSELAAANALVDRQVNIRGNWYPVLKQVIPWTPVVRIINLADNVTENKLRHTCQMLANVVGLEMRSNGIADIHFDVKHNQELNNILERLNKTGLGDIKILQAPRFFCGENRGGSFQSPKPWQVRQVRESILNQLEQQLKHLAVHLGDCRDLVAMKQKALLGSTQL